MFSPSSGYSQPKWLASCLDITSYSLYFHQGLKLACTIMGDGMFFYSVFTLCTLKQLSWDKLSPGGMCIAAEVSRKIKNRHRSLTQSNPQKML